MQDGKWVKEVDVAITVCDATGIILEMNEKACEMFKQYGGRDLTGKNVLDCHPPDACSKLKEMLRNQTANCYTIEKNGVKKLIYQTPWYKDRKYMGIIELVMEIPFEVPHFQR